MFGVQIWTEKKEEKYSISFLGGFSHLLLLLQPGAAWLVHHYSKLRLIYSQLKRVYKEQSQLSAGAETDRPLHMYIQHTVIKTRFVLCLHSKHGNLSFSELNCPPYLSALVLFPLWYEEKKMLLPLPSSIHNSFISGTLVIVLAEKNNHLLMDFEIITWTVHSSCTIYKATPGMQTHLDFQREVKE